MARPAAMDGRCEHVMSYDYASGKVPHEVRDLAKMIADWSAPASNFQFYLFGSLVRGDHGSDSDVDLHCVLPPNPTHEATMWWTNQNCVEDFASLRTVLPGPLKWLEQHAPLRPEVEQGKVVHRDRNVVCVWVQPKPVAARRCSRCGMCHGISRWTYCRPMFATPTYLGTMLAPDCCDLFAVVPCRRALARRHMRRSNRQRLCGHACQI
jgi:predicted nucleotidyltransferase